MRAMNMNDKNKINSYLKNLSLKEMIAKIESEEELTEIFEQFFE